MKTYPGNKLQIKRCAYPIIHWRIRNDKKTKHDITLSDNNFERCNLVQMRYNILKAKKKKGEISTMI